MKKHEINGNGLEAKVRRRISDAQLANLFAESAEGDRELAEEGMEEYERGLASEAAE